MRRLIPILSLSVGLPAVALSQVDTPAGTVYVDPAIAGVSCRDYDGDAARCGGGDGLAFATIVDATRALQPGQVVLIRPGEYAGGIVVETGGTAQAPVVIRAMAPGVIIDGSGDARDALFVSDADHVHIEGITIRNASRSGLRISLSDHVQVRDSAFRDNGSWGIFTDFSNHTLIENCETSGSGTQHGIYISNSSDQATVRGNRVHDNAGSGIQINADASMGGDGVSSHAVIENNIVYGNGQRGGAAINFDGVTHSIIRNNLLYENHAGGIALFQIDGGSESHSNQILNNTIVNARFSRWALDLQNTAGNKVFNNIILNDNRFRGSILARAPLGAGFESDFNVLMDSLSTDGEGQRRMSLDEWQALGYDHNSLIGERRSLFSDDSPDDYRLAGNSPAIDRGTALDLVETDLTGTQRPAGNGFDVGAFEFIP